VSEFAGFTNSMNDYKADVKLEAGVLHVRLSGEFPYAVLERP
jgi:hypothetical protein